MYKIGITLLLFALVLYYVMCFAEIFGFVKFSKKGIKLSKFLIPFYYIFFEKTNK